MRHYLSCFIQMKDSCRSTHAFLIRCMQQALGPLQRSLGRMEPGAAPHWHRGEKKNQTLFLRAWLLPSVPPSHICIYFERRVRLSLFKNCSSWADPTHSWALAAGSAFPASLSREPRKEGLRAWQQTRSTLAPPREDEPVNAVKPGFCLPGGSRNGVLEETGSAFLTAALLVWVEKHFWLGNVKQRTQRGGLFFLPPAKQLIFDFSPDSN